MADDRERFVDAMFDVALTVAIVVCICMGLASCQTIEAAQAVPEGYWTATWGLVKGFALDVWSVVQFLLPV